MLTPSLSPPTERLTATPHHVRRDDRCGGDRAPEMIEENRILRGHARPAPPDR
jgi:hypothetical protein